MPIYKIAFAFLLLSLLSPLWGQEDPPGFVNDPGRPDYINPLREIIAIGTQLGYQVAEDGTASYNDKYSIEYLPSNAPDKLGSDIFSLSERAGVNHIRNLRHIISGYLRKRYAYNRSDALTISTSITNYNARLRGNIHYVEQKFAPEVLAKLEASRIGLGLRYEEWPGQTQMLIPLISGSSPEIDLVELQSEISVEEEVPPIVEEAPQQVVEKPAEEPIEEQPARFPFVYLAIAVLIVLLFFLWFKKRKKSPPPLQVSVVEAKYFPKCANYFQAKEVPYDQYQTWLAKHKDTIARRGNLTYIQAKNISKSGRIQGLHFDEQTQIVQTTSAFGISCIGQFAIARWNGVPEKTALQIAVLQGMISGNIISNERDIVQSFELISWLLVDKLYKATDFGRAAVYNAASLLLEKDVRGAAAKSYLAKVLRSNDLEALTQMPLHILPSFAPPEDLITDKAQHKSLQRLMEDYAMTADQFAREPLLTTWAQKDFAELEGLFDQTLRQKEQIHLQDEQIRAEISSLEQQIRKVL